MYPLTDTEPRDFLILILFLTFIGLLAALLIFSIPYDEIRDLVLFAFVSNWIMFMILTRINCIMMFQSLVSIVAGTIALVYISTQYDFILEYFSTVNSLELQYTVLGLILILAISCFGLIGVYGFYTTQSIYYKTRYKILSVKLSSTSEPHIGGTIYLDVTYSAHLLNGFFSIIVLSPYGEESSVRSWYDNKRQLGYLKGEYRRKEIKLRYPVSRDISSGEYTIIVKLYDIQRYMFGRSRWTVAETPIKVIIAEQ